MAANRAGIADRHDEPALLLPQANVDRASGRRALDRIRQQIAEHLVQASGLRLHAR